MKRKIKITKIRGGKYTTVSNYSKIQKITPQTTINRMRRGEIKGIEIGPQTFLIKVA